MKYFAIKFRGNNEFKCVQKKEFPLSSGILICGINVVIKVYRSYLKNIPESGKIIVSMLAVLAHDPDIGIIDYGDTNVMRKNESVVVLEFLDFYKTGSSGKDNLKYLVFDSKFTNYENLKILNKREIKFVTIRRKGRNIVEKIENTPASKWKHIRINGSVNKKKNLNILDEDVTLKGYEGKV